MTTQPVDPPADPQPPVATPPWGSDEEFNPEKAWKLIQGLKADKEKLASRPVLDDDAAAKLAEYDKVVEARKSDLDKANEQVTRWQSDAEKWRAAAVASTVRAHAAAEFADPDDAVANLDPAKYLDADGQIDAKAIEADLAELLEAKPHYRKAEPAGPRAPAPNRSQGSGVDGKAALDPGQQFQSFIHAQIAGKH